MGKWTDGRMDGRMDGRVDVPSEHPSEISSRYVRASEPPLSWGGSVGGTHGLVWVNITPYQTLCGGEQLRGEHKSNMSNFPKGKKCRKTVAQYY